MFQEMMDDRLESMLMDASVSELITALEDKRQQGIKPSITEYRDLLTYVGAAI